MLDRLVLLSLLVLSCQRPSIGSPQHAGPVAGDPAGTEHESSNAAATSGSQRDAQNRVLNLSAPASRESAYVRTPGTLGSRR